MYESYNGDAIDAIAVWVSGFPEIPSSTEKRHLPFGLRSLAGKLKLPPASSEPTGGSLPRNWWQT